ncbi:hypothetical protein Tco_1390162 [Tanacetum coccineum]
MSTVMTSRFPSTNNQQPTTNSEHLPIQETKLPFKMVGLLFNKYKGDSVRVLLVQELGEMLQALRGNKASGQARVVKCYNCQGEWHKGRQCTQLKRLRNFTWFKEKMLLVQAQEAGQVLDEEQLAFLADPGIAYGQVTQTTIPQNAAF